LSSAPIIAGPPERAASAAAPRPAARSALQSWPLGFVLAASTAVALGTHWDISWHRSIGRDAFWSPPHVLIYLGAVLAGAAAAALIFSATFGATFGRDPRARRAAGVGVLGFRGPLGAFVCAWGGGAMLVSAPFDDWWHNAYGLDVKILSPPHVLLAVGILAIHLGALILLLAERNTASGARRRALDAMFLWVGGMILVAVTTVIMERTARIWMHDAPCFRAVALVVPPVLAAMAAGGERRGSASITAAIYTLFVCGLVWLLPLFPAEPKLGPVLYPVTSFVPPEFPLLVIVPAAAVDLLWPRLQRAGRWARAAAIGLAFTAAFVPAQWAMASFLMSPLGRNRFFGTIYFDYRATAEGFYRNYRFVPRLDPTPGGLALGLGIALLVAILTAWVGLGFGAWLRRVRR
jgi:hypothetical protein